MRGMKIIRLPLILGFFLVMACARSTPAPAPKTETAVSAPSREVATEGETLFYKNCAACHGSRGEGTSLGPNVAGHSIDTIKMQVRNPLGRAPAFPPSQISEKELDKLALYINNLVPATQPVQEWERAAPETVHHWMALLAIKNNDAADARQHLKDALTFVKEPKHKAEMEKTMNMIAQGKMHDAEHEIEEMAGRQSPSGISMQRFHLELTRKALEMQDLSEVKKHIEHFIDKATNKQKITARELLKKAEKGDFHEAEHELEELIKG